MYDVTGKTEAFLLENYWMFLLRTCINIFGSPCFITVHVFSFHTQNTCNMAVK